MDVVMMAAPCWPTRITPMNWPSRWARKPAGVLPAPYGYWLQRYRGAGKGAAQ
jgi:hypothetical protein